MTLKAYQYSLKPTKAQADLFVLSFGHNRFVWNWALALKSRYYRRFGQSLSKRQLQDQLVKKKNRDRYAWLYQVNAQSYLATLDHLDQAFSDFFNGKKKYPRFKSKSSHWHGYQNPQHTDVDFEQGCVKLPKIGWVKATLHRPFEGKIKTSTVKLTPRGRYRVSILVDDGLDLPVPSTIEPDFTVGVDLGIKSLAVASDGTVIENTRPLQAALVTLKKEQRILSRQKKGSKARAKQRLIVAKCHEKVANVRKHLLHQVSNHLVSKNQATSICIEDLHVKGLIRNKKLSRHIADVAWGELIRQFEYKCAWQGKNLITIDRFYPSSKTCSCCGGIEPDLTLSDRWYACDHCGMEMDRDLNAAINIKQQGLKQVLEQVGTTCAVKCSPKSRLVQSSDLAKGTEFVQYESAETHARTAHVV